MAEGLKAGTCVLDITPPLGISLAGSFSKRYAKKIHDPLLVKALVLTDGDTRLAIVICDLIVLVREDVDAAKQMIADRLGIPPEMVLVAATHTHTGPTTMGLLGVEREEDYMRHVRNKIPDAVSVACDNVKDVEFDFGLGHEDSIVFNRRYWMKDGSVKMNPGALNPDIIRAAGPIDPDVGVLCLRKPGHGPAAVLCNYALHYVGTGESEAVSAGYFEFFAEAIRQMMGQNVWTAIGNGCCGDINNVNVREKVVPQGPYDRAVRVARILAAEVVKVVERMQFDKPGVPLAGRLEKLVIPRRRPTDEQIKAARELLEKEPDGTTRDHVYAREHLALLDGPKEDETYIHAMRIGDLGIVGLPGEIFVEAGMDIKAQSPFKQTFTIELANDWIGYIPMRHSFAEGGYETWLARSSRAVPEAAEMMTNTALKLLNELHDAG